MIGGRVPFGASPVGCGAQSEKDELSGCEIGDSLNYANSHFPFAASVVCLKRTSVLATA